MSKATAVRLLRVRIDAISPKQAIQRAEQFLNEPWFHHVVTPGPEFLLEATVHEKFRKILNQADLSLPDGMGLKVAALVTGQNLPHRVTGVDFVHDLLALAAKEGKTVFFFGSHGLAEAAARAALKKYPNLKIAGMETGFRGPWQKQHDRQVIAKIHLAKPDILLVALGAPKQELWISQHRAALHDVTIAVGVGRTFDYLAGKARRAPKVMRQLGLEWLNTYLFASRYYQPSYRRQRITNATWHFIMAVIRHHYVRR